MLRTTLAATIVSCFLGCLWGQPQTPEELILPTVLSQTLSNRAFFQTQFTVVNLSNTTQAGAAVAVFTNAGEATEPHCPTGSPPHNPFALSIPPSGMRHVPTAPDTPAVEGWARITGHRLDLLRASAELALVFREPPACATPINICAYSTDEIHTVVSLPAVEPAQIFRAPVIITSNRNTAFAMVNPSDRPATVRIELFDPDGQPVLIDDEFPAVAQLEIPPGRRFAAHIWEILFEFCSRFGLLCVQPPPPPLPEMFHGSATFSSDVPIAVGGLYVLLPGGELLTVPVSSP